MMNTRTCHLVALLALICIAPTLHASDTDRAQTERVLNAMHNASTWGHPDLFGQFTGMRFYAEGRYKKAMVFFLSGARYADKVSQLSIGLMYLNGQGVKRDPTMAYAWVAVAAERGYPPFEATRQRIWEQLTPEQRQTARIEQEKVAAKYGDRVAKPRMSHELGYWRSMLTGSHTGFNSGAQHIDISGGSLNCSGDTIEGTTIQGCGGNFDAAWRWDPKQYFQHIDERWNSTVSVGDLQPVAAPDAHKAADKEQP